MTLMQSAAYYTKGKIARSLRLQRMAQSGSVASECSNCKLYYFPYLLSVQSAVRRAVLVSEVGCCAARTGMVAGGAGEGEGVGSGRAVRRRFTMFCFLLLTVLVSSCARLALYIVPVLSTLYPAVIVSALLMSATHHAFSSNIANNYCACGKCSFPSAPKIDSPIAAFSTADHLLSG